MFRHPNNPFLWRGLSWCPPAGCWVVALALLALLAAPAAADPGAEAPQTRKVVDAYRSGSASITLERFEPAADGKYPAILLLHAVDGLEKPYGDQYRAAARRFAEKGYVVLLVHYFDRTGAGAKQVQAVSALFSLDTDHPG